jgi:hypothetical protein
LSAATLVRPGTQEGCEALHSAVAAVMVAFAVFFATFRPHRVAFIDGVCILANGLSAVLSLIIGFRWGSAAIEAIFIAVIVVAFASIAFNVTVVVMELVRWRRVELQRCDAEAALRANATKYEDEEMPVQDGIIVVALDEPVVERDGSPAGLSPTKKTSSAAIFKLISPTGEFDEDSDDDAAQEGNVGDAGSTGSAALDEDRDVVISTAACNHQDGDHGHPDGTAPREAAIDEARSIRGAAATVAAVAAGSAEENSNSVPDANGENAVSNTTERETATPDPPGTPDVAVANDVTCDASDDDMPTYDSASHQRTPIPPSGR